MNCSLGMPLVGPTCTSMYLLYLLYIPMISSDFRHRALSPNPVVESHPDLLKADHTGMGSLIVLWVRPSQTGMYLLVVCKMA